MPISTAQDQAKAADIIDALMNAGPGGYSEEDAQWLAWNVPADGKAIDFPAKMFAAIGEPDERSDGQVTGHVPGHGNVSANVREPKPRRKLGFHWVGNYEVLNYEVPVWMKMCSAVTSLPKRITGQGAWGAQCRPFTELAESTAGERYTVLILPRHFATKLDGFKMSGLAYKVVTVGGQAQCITTGFRSVDIAAGSAGRATVSYPDWMHRRLAEKRQP